MFARMPRPTTPAAIVLASSLPALMGVTVTPETVELTSTLLRLVGKHAAAWTECEAAYEIAELHGYHLAAMRDAIDACDEDDIDFYAGQVVDAEDALRVAGRAVDYAETLADELGRRVRRVAERLLLACLDDAAFCARHLGDVDARTWLAKQEFDSNALALLAYGTEREV